MREIIPIFIGGCPRSGTTMLASMLGNCYKVLVTPESQFKFSIINKSNGYDLVKIIQKLNQNFRFKIWQVHISEQDFLNYFNGVKISPSKIIEYLLNQYNSRSSMKKFNYWIDHTPENIRYAKTLLKEFPNAKFIHIIRDGRAIANSLKKVPWGGHSTYFTSTYWATNVSYGLALEKFLPKDKILTVKYEDIILKSEKTLRRICNFIGIQFTYKLLSSDGFDVPGYTKKQHTLVGRKLKNDRIDSWRSSLSQQEIRIFENRTNELLEYLGYSLEYNTNDLVITKTQKIKIFLNEGLYYFINRSRQKKRIKLVIQNENRHNQK